MTRLRALAAMAALLLSAQALADAGEDFRALLDEHWEWTLDSNPVLASETLGDRRGNDRWMDISLAAIEAREQQQREFLRRAYAIDPAALNAEDQLNHELFRRELQDNIDAAQFKDYLQPFRHRGGIQNPENLTTQLRLATVADYEDWIARISALDEQIDATIRLAEARSAPRHRVTKDSDATHSGSARLAGR